METFYVLRKNGAVKRIAKIVDNALAYAWENGQWIPMAGLLKIQNEVTDYEEISKEEAERLTRNG